MTIKQDKFIVKLPKTINVGINNIIIEITSRLLRDLILSKFIYLIKKYDETFDL